MENKIKTPRNKTVNIAKPAPVQPAQAPAPAPTSSPTQNNTVHHNGLAIASMITGIIAISICTLPVVGLILGVAALILGITGFKKANDKGMAIAGISTGGLSIVINIFITLMFIIGISIFGEIISQVDYNHGTSNEITKTTNKEFAKGEVAVFGNYKVKVNSVTRNYSPKDEIDKASSGNELIVVNVSVKNVDQYPTHFSTTDIILNADGVASYATFLNIEPILASGTLSSGETATGNVVFEVKKDAVNLKLQYESYNKSESSADTQGDQIIINGLAL